MNRVSVIVGIFVFCTVNFCSSYNHTNTTPRSRMRLITHRSINHRRPNSSFHSTGPPQFSKRQTNPDIDCDNQRGDILYPEPKKEKKKCVYNICWNVDDYPQQEIKKKFMKTPFLDAYFNISVNPQSDVAFDNRFGTEDEEPLCLTQKHTVYPQTAKNTKNEEKVIINVEGKKQGIVFETCLDNRECRYGNMFPDGYTSYCKQIFVVRRLMVFVEGEQFVFDTFEIPSCCVCTLRKA